MDYVRGMERLRLLARRFALDILIVILAAEGVVEVARWHRDEYQSRPAWIAVPAIVLIVVPMLGRRRFPFCAPAAVWVIAAAVSLTDGWLVVTPVSTFLAANIAAFLLGNVGDSLQARLGLAFVLCGAVIVVDNKPDHDNSELVFVPVMFAIAWAAGYTLRERARHAEVAERRAVHAVRDGQAAARAAAAAERGRIARELHDTIAHAVSVMVLQVRAVRHQLPDAHQEHKNVLRDVEQTGRTALTDMRHLLDAMREDDGGVEARRSARPAGRSAEGVRAGRAARAADCCR